jgi:uncharacterized protein (TIGR02118 family)
MVWTAGLDEPKFQSYNIERVPPASTVSTGMIVITVLYPAGPEGSFDRDYYVQTHIPLVKARWTRMGLEDVRLLRGTGTGDGEQPPYQVMALLSFHSMEDFEKAAQAHGPEIFADIPKFTSVKPIVQINETLG